MKESEMHKGGCEPKAPEVEPATNLLAIARECGGASFGTTVMMNEADLTRFAARVHAAMYTATLPASPANSAKP
jgi:hypothetical protein